MNKKIILIAFEIGVMDGYESVRSAHIQVPYKLAQDLKRLGYDVLIATNPLSKGTSIPNDISHIPIKFIPDPRKRKDGYVMHTGFSNKIDIFGVFKAIIAIKKLVGKDKNTTIHFVNGSLGVGLFASVTSFIIRSSKVIWTPSFPFGLPSKLLLPLLRQIDELACSSEYLTRHFSLLGLSSSTIKHGTTRTFNLENKKKFRVLFWRDPSYENGADIAINVFRALASEFKNITFTMMVRPHWDSLIADVDDKNIEIYEYPYPDEVNLEGVLSETIACYFPFRELSTNPQLCILESLNAGIPCFVSNIESVSEYVLDQNFLIEVNTKEQGILYLRKFLNERFEEQTVTSPKSNGYEWDNFTQSYIDLY